MPGGFLPDEDQGYFFVVVGLCYDLGQPWRLPYPMTVSFGVTSVLFLVGWHVALYLTTQFVEFSPAVFEWLGWKQVRKFYPISFKTRSWITL